MSDHWISVVAGWVRTWVEAQDWLDSVAPLVTAAPDWALVAAAPLIFIVALGLIVGVAKRVRGAFRDGARLFTEPEEVAKDLFDPPKYARDEDLKSFADTTDIKFEVSDTRVARLEAAVLALQEQSAAEHGRAAPGEADRARVAAAVAEIVADPSAAAREAADKIEAGHVTEGLVVLAADAQNLAKAADRAAAREALEAEAQAEAKRASRRYYQLGQLSRGIDLEQALAAYQNAVKFDPSLHGVRLEIAQILRKLGRSEEAERELRNLIAALGDTHSALSAAAWTTLGQILARNRATMSKALSAHRKAEQLRRSSSDRGGWAFNVGAIGDIYLRQGRLHDALAHHQDAAKVTPRPAEYTSYNHWRMGQALLRLGRIGEALESFSRAMELARIARRRDMVLKVTEGLAQTFRMKGELNRADAAYQTGLRQARTAEDRVRMMTGLGLLDLDRGENDKAAKHFRDALALAKASPRKLPHKFQEAQLAYLTALGGKPEDALSQLGIIAEHYKSTGEVERLAATDLLVAKVHVMRLRPKEARRRVEMARPQLQRYSPADVTDCDVVLAEILLLERKLGQARDVLETAAARIRAMKAWGKLEPCRIVRRRIKEESFKPTKRRAAASQPG